MIRLRNLQAIIAIVAAGTLILTGRIGRAQVEDLAPPDVSTSASFLAPNETTPIEIAPLLQQAPSGFELAVGADRGLIAAGLNSRITGVVFADSDPNVVYFNRVNVALLEASQNRKQYLKLRLEASFDAWKELSKIPTLTPEARQLLSSEAAWRWWRIIVRENFGLVHGPFTDFHARPPESKSVRAWVRKKRHPYHAILFQDANYLWNDEQFDRVSKLAKDHNLWAVEANLSKPQQVAQIVQELKNRKQTLGVISPSNAWMEPYMGKDGLARMLEELRPVSDPKALLILTARRRRMRYNNVDKDWHYFGYRLETVFGSGVQNFVNDVLPHESRITDDWVGTLDGVRVPELPLTPPRGCFAKAVHRFISAEKGK